MIIERNDDGSVSVTREIQVAVGQLRRINPSEAFMGIESGVVKVIDIIDSKSIDPEDTVGGIDNKDLIHMVEVYRDSILELAMEAYNEELHRLDNEPWVVYRYPSDNEWNILPLWEFVVHTMYY